MYRRIHFLLVCFFAVVGLTDITPHPGRRPVSLSVGARINGVGGGAPTRALGGSSWAGATDVTEEAPLWSLSVREGGISLEQTYTAEG